MKVISPGRDQKGWAREEKCTGHGGGGGCQAVLLVEEADLFKTSSTCHDETDYFITFRCISCGVLTDPKNVPYEVRARAMVRRDPTLSNE